MVVLFGLLNFKHNFDVWVKGLCPERVVVLLRVKLELVHSDLKLGRRNDMTQPPIFIRLSKQKVLQEYLQNVITTAITVNTATFS